MPRKSAGGKVKVTMDFRKDEDEESVSLSLFGTHCPKVEKMSINGGQCNKRKTNRESTQ